MHLFRSSALFKGDLMHLLTRFPNDKFSKHLQTIISNLMKMAESPPNGVENTVGKGEIAHYKQFLLFPQCLQKVCTADA